MSWEKRETTDGVGIGDGDGQQEKAGGLLAAIKTVEGSDGPFQVYEMVQKDGTSLGVFGSASINSRLSEGDIGSFVKFHFEGWGKSKGGRKFKQIDVQVWGSDFSDDMKKWPRFDEIRNGASKAAMVAAFDSPPDSLTKDDADDLPF